MRACRKRQSFVLQQMKCGLLDSDNPADGPWRKVVHPPLWACHSLPSSFTRSLPHSLTSRAPLLQNSNTAPFWLMIGSPEQQSHVSVEEGRLVGRRSSRSVRVQASSGRPRPRLSLRLRSCHSGLVSQLRPFHKCWSFGVK